jgi:acetyl esterase/lipase
MNFLEYAAQIQAIGREINPETLKATRAIIEPLLDKSMLDGLKITRDLKYGNDERHRLDVFTDEGSKGIKPVLLFVHGGGFIAGDKHTEGSPFYSNIGAWAVKNGFTGVNMTYRLAPENPWPAGIEDIRAVVEWIKNKGEDYGLDADRIFLMGQSAGGAHAAGYIAHSEIYGGADHGLAGAILLSGVYDFEAMPTTPMEEAYVGDNELLYEERSSLEGLASTDLPLLLTMAEYDPAKFQAQTIQFLSKHWYGCVSEETLPRHIFLLGQNHLSAALYLGLQDDQLAPQLKRFIEEYS